MAKRVYNHKNEGLCSISTIHGLYKPTCNLKGTANDVHGDMDMVFPPTKTQLGSTAEHQATLTQPYVDLIYLCTCVCVCVYDACKLYKYVCICIRMRYVCLWHMSLCTSAEINWSDIYIDICMYTYVYIYTHFYIYTHMHVYPIYSCKAYIYIMYVYMYSIYMYMYM